ncbi:MAG: SAM-dependent methyltransferase [Maribacter sp.]|jgi:SAM-dependent methyltransferase
MLLSLIKNISFIKRSYLKIGNIWVDRKLKTVVPHLKGNVVDIGSGNGMVAHYLQKKGHHITTLDVGDLSIHDSIKTIVYDGKKMPFKNKEFNTGLILTVLHHTDDPIDVLQEAARVCEQLIIIEDIYNNIIQQYLTYGMDTLVNLGHSNMTYQNKSDQEWKTTFNQLGLEVVSEQQKRVLLFFRQVTYVVCTAP